MPDARKRSPWPVLTGVLGIAAALAVVAWHSRTVSQSSERLARLEQENRDLRSRSEQMAGELERLRRSLPDAPPREAPERPLLPGENPAAVESTRLLIQVREKLAAANNSIQALELRIRELEANIEKVTEDNKRLAASEDELKDRLASTNRVLEAVRSEVKGKDERLSQVMVTNNQLQAQNRELADKTAQLPRLLRDLEDLNRRREGHLGNVLRRYRDITDQYRALAARDQSGESGASAEITRITNSIQLAEEDLRQVTSLGAQATRIQQRIVGK